MLLFLSVYKVVHNLLYVMKPHLHWEIILQFNQTYLNRKVNYNKEVVQMLFTIFFNNLRKYWSILYPVVPCVHKFQNIEYKLFSPLRLTIFISKFYVESQRWMKKYQLLLAFQLLHSSLKITVNFVAHYVLLLMSHPGQTNLKYYHKKQIRIKKLLLLFCNKRKTVIVFFYWHFSWTSNFYMPYNTIISLILGNSYLQSFCGVITLGT